MPALDYLLTAPDPFALLGIERRFDVDPAELDRRYGALLAHAGALSRSDPDQGKRVLEKLAEGRRVLADPVARGGLLLKLLGGAADAQTDSLPPRFRERLESARQEGPADWMEQERGRLTGVASNLFRLRGSADNGVVLRARRRQIRQTLNAIRAIDDAQARGTG